MTSMSPAVTDGKICTKCGTHKPLSEYYVRPDREGTHQSHCKDCKAAYSHFRYMRIRKMDLCECGREKYYLSSTCKSCSTRLTTRRSWETNRQRMMDARREVGMRKRKTRDDLRWEHFSHRPSENRYAASYTLPDGKQRVIPRYRWVWEEANGVLPQNVDIHHINGDSTDDRLENLQALTREEHHRLHALEMRAEGKARGTGRFASVKAEEHSHA